MEAEEKERGSEEEMQGNKRRLKVEETVIRKSGRGWLRGREERGRGGMRAHRK